MTAFKSNRWFGFAASAARPKAASDLFAKPIPGDGDFYEMAEELTSEDTLIEWLKRDSRYNRFPIEISRDWIEDPSGYDDLVIRLKYDDLTFINFPYDSKVYGSAWDFFNRYWQLKKLTSQRPISQIPSTLLHRGSTNKRGPP